VLRYPVVSIQQIFQNTKMLSSFFVFFVDLRRKEVRLVDDVFFEGFGRS
jgi:hypothetical protein